MDLPSLSADTDSLSDVSNSVKGLLPWLPDPYRCDDCGVFCEASASYDYQMYEYTPSWECPECNSKYRRVEPWHDS